MRNLLFVLAFLGALAPSVARGQDLADLDYDHLKFRGFGLDWGYLYPTRVDRTGSFGLRFDMGYAGPGLRIVPNVTYWRSPLDQKEVTRLQDRIAGLVADQTGGPPPNLNLGKIDWTDVAVGVDGHIVWHTPFALLTYGGLGVAAHFLNGSSAFNGTIIDDLLDSVTAGFNLHFGAEYPLNDRFRIYSLAKYEVLSDLQYLTVRVGWQVMTGPNAPGEGR